MCFIGTMCNGTIVHSGLHPKEYLCAGKGEKSNIGYDTSDFSSRVEETFSKETADGWDEKSKFVTYHGAKNPIMDEVMMNVKNGMSILDVGCGTGKLISRIDKKIENSYLIGLDISNDMIEHARNKVSKGNNEVSFIADDFIKHDFKSSKFDIIIFSNVLHHVSDPIQALECAKKLLSDDGIILFSVPGANYLSETFEPKDLSNRYSVKEMDEIVTKAGLYSVCASRKNFLMTFDSYEMYVEYLKSIGTYQKIIGYTNEKWSDEFNKKILERFSKSTCITGEYLTYSCKDRSKILV